MASEGKGVAPSYWPMKNGDALVDLHGLPVEVAKIAVQVALQDLILGTGPPLHDFPGRKRGDLGDLIIVTGRGKGSPGGIALIRPAVISFLNEELRLEVRVLRQDFPGRLRVPAAELHKLRGDPEPSR